MGSAAIDKSGAFEVFGKAIWLILHTGSNYGSRIHTTDSFIILILNLISKS